MLKSTLCPCESQVKYSLCCGRFHKGNLHAPTAEALMRSRYSAYVLKKAQYIFRTWDKSTRPPLHILREESSQSFNYLEIINSSNGTTNDTFGTVEFIANYSTTESSSVNTNNNIQQHHENSYFIKENNKWLYVNELSKIDSGNTPR